MKRLTLVLIAAALLATGCGHPLIPAAYTRPVAPAVPGKAATVTPGRSPAALIGKRLTGKPVIGVNLYAIGGQYTQAGVELDASRTLQYIKNKLNASAVDIVWNLYTANPRSNTIRTTAKSLSPANVELLAQMAEADGLKVYLRPLIMVESGAVADWEGKIKATNPPKWFNSYYRAELPYLKVAQELHVTEFVVQTEMSDMNKTPGWWAFYKRVAKIYHGALSYASWDGNYFPPHTHLQPLANLGMDMYESMPQLSPSASEAKVFAGWKHFFSQVPASVLQRTTIQEMGIEGTRGAYKHPSTLGAPGTPDPTVQTNWFKAACQSVRKYDLAGIFFWKVDLNDNPAHPSGAMSNFEGRAAARVISRCAALVDG